MRNLKKLMSLLLCMAMLLSNFPALTVAATETAPCTGLADCTAAEHNEGCEKAALDAGVAPIADATGYPVLQLDVSTKIEKLNDGRSRYFSFTPKVTDNYEFYSSSAEDSIGYIWDINMKCLASNNNISEANLDFSVSCVLMAGVTYILEAENDGEDDYDTFFVHLRIKHDGERTVVTQPTCTSTGEKNYVCKGCGGTFKETIPFAAHSYVNGICSVCSASHQVMKTGNCGYRETDNITWKMYDSGLLEITGSGEMFPWTSSKNVPWHEYRSIINKVTVGSGITSIGDYAFCECQDLTSVSLADSITTIGDYAFQECLSLTSVTLPANLESLLTQAFCRSGLTSVTLPNKVKNLWAGAFSYCANLTQINVEAGSTKFSSVDGVLFSADKTELWCYPSGKSSSYNGVTGVYEMPDTVTDIKDRAFCGCTSLTGVVFSKNLQNIYGLAFYDCTGLTEIKFPDSLRYIGPNAFEGCTGLDYLELSPRIWKLDRFAFSRCNFEYVKIPKGELSEVVADAFWETSVGAVYYEGSSEQWGGISIGSDNTSIQQNIYYKAFGSFGENVKYNIFNGILTISGQGKMTDLPAPGSSTYTAQPWYDNAQTKPITGIVVEDGVTSIGDYAFYNCDEVTSVSIGKDVKVIGKRAFNWCNAQTLNEIVLPEGLETIREEAFWSCTWLKTMTVPASVTTIEDRAFYYCDRLSSIVFKGNFPNMDADGEHFYELPALTVYYPANNPTWTEDVRLNYGNNQGVTWRPYCPEGGHNFTKVTYTWATDYSTCTASLLCANGCGTADTASSETVTATTQTNQPTCEGEGSTVYTATFASAKFETQTHTEKIEPTGHTYDQEDIAAIYRKTPANCTEPAVYYKSCLCDKAGTDTFSGSVLDYTNHNFVSGVCSRCALPEGLEYTVVNGKVTVTDYKGTAAELVIPATIEGKPVTAIGGAAFFYITSLKSVALPDGVTSIGSNAFNSCSGLTSIVIPASVVEIGDGAFDFCTKLEDVYYGGTAAQFGALTNATAGENLRVHDRCTSAEGHWTADNQDPTCGDDGYTREKCSHNYTRNQETVPATGKHSYTTATTPPSCTEDGYTTYTCSVCQDSYNGDIETQLGHIGGAATCKEKAVCTRCGKHYGKLNGSNHSGGTEIRDAKTATCTNEGYTGDTYCLGCTNKIANGQTIPMEEHNRTPVVTDPTCTEKGYTTHTCSSCGDDLIDSYQDPLNHDMGQWSVVTEPLPGVDGVQRRDCNRCEHYETKPVLYQGDVLMLEGEDLLSQDKVWIDGLPYEVKGEGENRYVDLPNAENCYITTYSYHVGDPNDIHTQYPTGMKAYKVENGKITYIPELENLLQYSGSSIRITGVKGIRMITSLNKDVKAQLTGNGLAGYKLLEYGTALAFASEVAGDGDLVLGKPYTRSNFAYKRGVADPVFATSGDLTQYTNVLVGFNLDQCKDDIAMRPYIILEDASGAQITLYGGTIYRSIGYIAYQNRGVFQPKSASYNYVWEIIHHVYGDKFDADFKG